MSNKVNNINFRKMGFYEIMVYKKYKKVKITKIWIKKISIYNYW